MENKNYKNIGFTKNIIICIYDLLLLFSVLFFFTLPLMMFSDGEGIKQNIFYAKKKIDEIDDIELREFFDLHKNMDKSDLSNATKEYKKYLTQWAGDGKTFLLNEEVSLVLKKFKLSKINNQVFLRSDFTMSYLHAMNIPMNLLISFKNDHILLIVSECWVNCSKQTSKFEKMIKPLFSN